MEYNANKKSNKNVVINNLKFQIKDGFTMNQMMYLLANRMLDGYVIYNLSNDKYMFEKVNANKA